MTDLISKTDPNLALLRAAELKTRRAEQTEKLAKDMNVKAIDKAAKEFEAVFMTEMMKPMFEGLEPDPMFGGGKGEEVFQSMMLEQYGKIMAERGGIGIGDMVKAEMIRIQADAQRERMENEITAATTAQDQQAPTEGATEAPETLATE